MTQFSKTTRQLLFEARYESSRQDIQRLKQDLSNLRKDIERVDTVNEQSARSSRESTQALDREAAAAREAAAEYDRLAREKTDAGNAQGSGGRLGRVADFGSRGAAVAGAFAGGTELANVLGLLDDATTAFATFGAVGAVATVGIGAASLAFAEMNRQLEEAKKRAEEYITALRDLNEAIAAGATTSDLQERRDDLQVQVDGITSSTGRFTDIITRYQTALDDIDARNQTAFGLSIQGLIELAATNESFNRQTAELTNNQITTISALTESVEKETAAQSILEAQIELVNYAIENGQTAFADAAANAAALEQSLRDSADAAGQQATAQVQSSDAIRARRDALQSEIGALEGSIDALRQQATVTNQYDDIADNLQRTVNQLTNELERNNAAFREALGREETAALAKEYTDLTAAIAKNKAALKDIRDASIKAYDDMLAAVAKIEADAQDARNKALADAADAQSEAYLDHLDKLADIEKRAYRDIQDAVANRDAIAFVRAKAARQDAIDDEQKSYAKRERDLQKSLDKQLSQITENADKAIRAQRDQYYKESSLRVQQYQQILADQVLLQNRLNFVNQIGADNATNAATRYWTAAEKLANDALAKLYTASAINPIGFGTSTGAGTGNSLADALGSRMTQIARGEIRATLRGAIRSRSR